MKEKAKYLIVEQYIKDQIENGTLKPGDQLETEFELAKKFDVSRLTVNKAISRLALDGLIERTPGKGSFVKQTMFTADYKTVGSFTDYSLSQNCDAGSRLIEFKIFNGDELPGNVRQILELKPDEKAYYFVRIRTLDNKPLVMMSSYVPMKLIPNFDISILNGSLWKYFDSLQLPRTSIKSRLTAILPDEYTARNLEIDPCTALLKHDHISYTNHHTPLEYCVAIYIGHRYAYEIIQEDKEY